MSQNIITLSIHSYDLHATKSISITFDNLLTTIFNSSSEDKVQLINKKEIRLEDFIDQQDYCFFDFRLRTADGPNKAKRLDRAEPISLNPDEEFSYHAAGAYDKLNKKLTIQYSVKGPKANDMQSYINSFLLDNQEFIFLPIFSRDYQKFMKHAAKITNFRARLDTDKLDGSLPKKDVPLLKAYDIGTKETKADLIDISFLIRKSSKNKNLFVEKIKSFVLGCKNLPDDAIPIMKAKGEYDDGSKFEVELIEGLTLKETFKLSNIKGTPPNETRYHYLKQSLKNI